MNVSRFFLIVLLCGWLGACARTGALELPPDEIKKHATPQQPIPPSASLAPQTHY